jgi:hypothetical protein
MISPEFDIVDFISSVKDKNKYDIIRLAESEAKEAEKISETKGYGQNYVEDLRVFDYFMRYGQKPEGINGEHFKMFRSICEKLVAKKQLPPDVLNMFDSVE